MRPNKPKRGFGAEKSLLQGPRKEIGLCILKRPKIPLVFREEFLKAKLGGWNSRVCNLLLIGWWEGLLESSASAFWFHPVWGPNLCRLEVTLIHLGGAPAPIVELGDVYQIVK